jgi:GT2 family glycosyltransferase
MLKSISVVIPNYNGKHLLQQNLESVVAALKNSNALFEIIIVDDASSDSSAQFIKHIYPEITLIINDVNQGFSVSCNKGIAIANNELILLLNTDIQLPVDYLSKQFKYFENPDTFGVMAKIIGFKDGQIQDTARHVSRSGFKIKTNKFFHLKDESFWCPTAYLSGANALVDSHKLKKMGGFDEIFSPFYGEDLDLGLRAWRLGWKCYFQPQSYCLHDHSSTTKNYKTRNWVKAIFFRNRFVVHAIHLNTIELVGWLLQIFFTDFIVLWVGFKFYFYRSLCMFLNMHRAIGRSRKKLEVLMAVHKSNISVKDIRVIMDEMLKGQTVINGKG